MVKGIRRPYKQPVAYYFTNSLKKFELKTILKIKNAQEAGLIVLVVCDQIMVNVGAIEELLKETKADYLRKEKDRAHNFFEVNSELRCLQKLTEEHVNPEKIQKIRVLAATQIFSHSVAVATEHLTDTEKLPKECRDLISITLLVDNLFDS
ncbi:Uncharacterized protein OBRU01_03943 [Operophtera brumata]|uniref:Uncharacterized protein n=1 Tax=Operophtera brumata TaxID=104452 RepID=A0A0L7LG45_OPEBR|nr:Uncharacterized protein OBRU01_03943 [Operophtera brumata]